MHHNNDEIFNLSAAPLRQRIVNVFGSKFNQRLVPVETDTNIVRVKGFVGKPEFARKTRGEQFLFVNDRFIRSSYLNHAVVNAYRGLLASDTYPLYFLYLEIDPAEIDVNIHPTKIEIKFQDERSVYAIVSSAVKQGLGKFNVVPSLDFDQEMSIKLDPLPAGVAIKSPEVKVNRSYNPFDTPNTVGWKKQNLDGWEGLYDIAKADSQSSAQTSVPPRDNQQPATGKPVFQLHNRFLVTQIKSGIVVIDQQKAHERILFERNMHHLEGNMGLSQKLLFPQTLEMPAADLELLTGYQEEIGAMGLEIEPFGKTTLKLTGIPAESKSNPADIVERLLHQIKNQAQLKLEGHAILAYAMARSTAISSGTTLDLREMQHIIDQLFACQQPYYSPVGKPTIATFTLDELEKNFE
jgi:DNA mismatch repair protein MutL